MRTGSGTTGTPVPVLRVRRRSGAWIEVPSDITGADIRSSPAAAADTVYVGNDSGTVYAVRA
ncbi:PQQ-binding-like beta-propeller repeat protein [Streptomyces ossamyceticus]